MIAASTHPFASWRAQKKVEKERYLMLARDMQTLASRLVICGMHVHAGTEDEELRIDLMNQAAYFLPHLLALSASSPFWEGQLTGLKAYRPTVFGNLPGSGLPEHFANADEWRHMLHLLEQTGLCDHASKIWWDARVRAPGSPLELRICDICTRLDDAVTIAALWQSILAMLYRLRADNQTWRRCRRTLVEENKWLAQRHGIGAAPADFGVLACQPFGALVEEIIELVRDEAMRLGCLPEVLARARDPGPRHQRRPAAQRLRAGARGGRRRARGGPKAVVDWLIEETMRRRERRPARLRFGVGCRPDGCQPWTARLPMMEHGGGRCSCAAALERLWASERDAPMTIMEYRARSAFVKVVRPHPDHA